MKIKIIYFIILVILILMPFSYSSNKEKMEEQKDTFEINSFISNSKKYIENDFLNENDINNLFDTAIKGQVDNKTLLSKFVKIFGKELKNTIGSLSIILAIIVIHSILKSISDSLENDEIARIIYYVQYILKYYV